jgi:hypothetical protein
MQQGSASVLQSKPLELVEQRSNGLHSQAAAAAKQGTTKAKQSNAATHQGKKQRWHACSMGAHGGRPRTASCLAHAEFQPTGLIFQRFSKCTKIIHFKF